MKNYDEMVELYNNGASIQQCADKCRITRQAMWDVLRRRPNIKMWSNLKYGKENHFFRGGIHSAGRAHNIIELAIHKGELIPQPCEVCQSFELAKDGRRKVVAHHDDYNEPLKVWWLCYSHHFEWHSNNTPVQLFKILPTMTKFQICSLGGIAGCRARWGQK